MAHIKHNIERYKLRCDYNQEDTLFVANAKRDKKKLLEEYTNLKRFNFKSNFIEKENVPLFLGSQEYHCGVTYEDSFGINGYKYCQEMKEVLQNKGVKIYEETPVLSFSEHEAITMHARVKADYIIVCADQFIPKLNALTEEIYHAQTFLLISQVLTENERKQIFPDRNLMVWDTDLVYTYFRISDNRLLLGGGSLLNFYNRYEKYHSKYMFGKLTHYFKKKFPQLDIQFEQFWPGLIGLSKDIAPICGRDKNYRSIYYIAATAGLPIAAAMANYCADHLVDGRDDLKDYFSPYRKFLISGLAQRILGTKLSFALSNLVAMKF